MQIYLYGHDSKEHDLQNSTSRVPVMGLASEHPDISNLKCDIAQVPKQVIASQA
jgi:hypothetical protein